MNIVAFITSFIYFFIFVIHCFLSYNTATNTNTHTLFFSPQATPGSSQTLNNKLMHPFLFSSSLVHPPDNTRYQPKQPYDYEDATNYPQPQQVLQRYKGPADTPRPALLEAPRKGKQLKISGEGPTKSPVLCSAP